MVSIIKLCVRHACVGKGSDSIQHRDLDSGPLLAGVVHISSPHSFADMGEAFF